MLVAARASAYGEWYKTTVNCPSCGEQNKKAFKLTDADVYHGDNFEDYNIEETDNGTYNVTLPYSKLVVECRLLTGTDETSIVKNMQKKKNKREEGLVLNQMALYIVSVNGYKEQNVIIYTIQNMVATDSRYLRNAVKAFTPQLRVVSDFECNSCEYEQELEVPFGADFFWPDR